MRQDYQVIISWGLSGGEDGGNGADGANGAGGAGAGVKVRCFCLDKLVNMFYDMQSGVKVRDGKCHGYDGYIRVKKLGSWGKKFGRPK